MHAPDTNSPAPRPFGPLRWAVSGALLLVVGIMLVQQWETTRAQAIAPHGPWLAVACLGLAAFYVLACECWRRWLGLLGAPIAYRDAFRAYFVSNLAKYVPGGAWNYVDRTILLSGMGVDGKRAYGSMVLDLACQVAAALLVGQLALGAIPGGALYAALGTIAIVAGLHPRPLGAAIALLERLLRRPVARVPYAYGDMLRQLALYTLNWAALGMSFAALAAAILPVRPTIALVGALPLAWAVGTLAVFFPAGLGMREAALVLVLHPVLPGGWPAVLAIVARLWLLAGEAATFGAAVWTTRRSSER